MKSTFLAYQPDYDVTFYKVEYLQFVAHSFLNGTPFAKDTPVICVQFIKAVLLFNEPCAHPQKIAQVILQKYLFDGIRDICIITEILITWANESKIVAC